MSQDEEAKVRLLTGRRVLLAEELKKVSTPVTLPKIDFTSHVKFNKWMIFFLDRDPNVPGPANPGKVGRVHNNKVACQKTSGNQTLSTLLVYYSQ